MVSSKDAKQRKKVHLFKKYYYSLFPNTVFEGNLLILKLYQRYSIINDEVENPRFYNRGNFNN